MSFERWWRTGALGGGGGLGELDLDRVDRAVRGEAQAAANRAIAAGADEETLEYVGAGAQGIVFTDASGRAFKVARRERNAENLEREAELLDALAETELADHAPEVIAFDAQHGVLVREHIIGRPGGWSDESRLHDLHREIERALRPQGFTAPEFKGDSYIIDEDGIPVLVDAGYAYRTGWRAAARLEREVAELTDPRDEMALIMITGDIRKTLGEGAITPDQARAYYRELEVVYGAATMAAQWRDLEWTIANRTPEEPLPRPERRRHPRTRRAGRRAALVAPEEPRMPRWVREGVSVKVKATPILRRHGLRTHGALHAEQNYVYAGDVGTVRRGDGGWYVEFSYGRLLTLDEENIDALKRVTDP